MNQDLEVVDMVMVVSFNLEIYFIAQIAKKKIIFLLVKIFD